MTVVPQLVSNRVSERPFRMNYFAHGFRFVDRPLFMAGTSTPDWLSAADRKTRLRRKRIEALLPELSADEAEFAAGAMRHLDDDQWFHATPAFHEITLKLTVLFRSVLDEADGHRPSFLGHITMELLLDGLLVEEYPDRLEQYFQVLDELDLEFVERTVNRLVKTPTTKLAPFIDLFRQVQFLRDYSDSNRLLMRLNGVMRRVKLVELPETCLPVFDQGREIVREAMTALLPDVYPFEE